MHEKHTVPFCQGDGGVKRISEMVLATIFPDFLLDRYPLSVEDRIRTNDGCTSGAAQAFIAHRGGIKMSTASNHPAVLELGYGSLNIKMRPMLGAYAILRMLEGPGRYKKPAGVLRYAYGGFYDEISCNTEEINGRKTVVTVTHTDVHDFEKYVKLAYDTAKQHNLHIIIATKKTIARSEKVFYEACALGLRTQGLVEGKNLDQPGGEWTGDFHHELTDDNETRLAINAAPGTNTYSNGGFLLMVDNVNGDGRSDVMNAQHGNYVMGSEVFCSVNGKDFSYRELPTGTADSFAEGPLPEGLGFFNPTAIIFTIAAELEKFNPGYKTYFDAVRVKTLAYIKRTPPEQWNTGNMIAAIAQYSASAIPKEVVPA